MLLMVLVVCVCERKRERGRGSLICIINYVTVNQFKMDQNRNRFQAIALSQHIFSNLADVLPSVLLVYLQICRLTFLFLTNSDICRRGKERKVGKKLIVSIHRTLFFSPPSTVSLSSFCTISRTGVETQMFDCVLFFFSCISSHFFSFHVLNPTTVWIWHLVYGAISYKHGITQP